MSTATTTTFIRSFDELTSADVPFAGGKGANLGELTRAGLPVPDGFVIGASAYAAFCDQTGLRERLERILAGVDVEDAKALEEASTCARREVLGAPVPPSLREAIASAYLELAGEDPQAPVAVRSSATAEDTASASFAGMNETFLNTCGVDAVVGAVQRCWASLFGARTIYYRAQRGFGQADMDIAVVVQRQLRSSRAGVMFTIDPSSGERETLVIEGSFGLGEAVVSGSVSPDRYVVRKSDLAITTRSVRPKELVIEPAPTGGTVTRPLSPQESMRPVLSDAEVITLAELGLAIEKHYGEPQDTEWSFDEQDRAWMLQSRPITTVDAAGHAQGEVLVRGLGAAPGSASGSVRLLSDAHDTRGFRRGDVLVAHMTTPDWVPLMRQAAAIVTDSGGMTCHAAIVSRELGIPCVVGTGEATRALRDGELVTVDATRGVVLEGAPESSGASQPQGAAPSARAAAPVTATRLLVNLSEPSQVSRTAALEVDGVGLLRAEMMVIEALDGAHPKQLIDDGGGEEFVRRMADALELFASGFHPRPVTYRTIDFRTNEFRGLRGGERFEPQEANPMIGYRGALRYTREPDFFALEMRALARVWDAGHENLHVMLPFVRTTAELERCRAMIAETGLLQRRGFELWIMAEVPSVLFNLARYTELGIAGISIGSNDLTQLILGADRDSELLADTFDERDEAVVGYLGALIARARELGLRTSICGQAPSVHPQYTDLLVSLGIENISVSVDAVERTRRLIASAEQRLLLAAARGERNAENP
ncbi:MAG TPA: phosphoenolpyruvate synthase [Solirubrobacteraceae bacterium]|jgi:pyruvate,water dikinase